MTFDHAAEIVLGVTGLCGWALALYGDYRAEKYRCLARAYMEMCRVAEREAREAARYVPRRGAGGRWAPKRLGSFVAEQSSWLEQ